MYDDDYDDDELLAVLTHDKNAGPNVSWL